MWKLKFVIFALGVFVEAERANLKNFPFIASITSNGTHICSGNILTRNYIVTSAPCVYGRNASLLEVHLGTTNLSVSGDVYKVLEIIFHPKYDNNKVANAAAVLRTEDMKYKSTVLPVSISRQDIGEGVPLTAAGWNLTDEPKPNGTLQLKNVTSLSNDECAKILNMSISDTVICTENDGSSDISNEFSDDGGPILENDSLVGIIISSNLLSESSTAPPTIQINVRLAELLNFLLDVLKLII